MSTTDVTQIFELEYVERDYPPQDIYLAGKRIGHVEYEGDGWGAFHTDGRRLGWGTAKSNAGQIVANYAAGKSGSLD
jgi:hypothetical protein